MSVVIIVVVGTKIARSRVLGTFACCKHNQLVDIGEKLVCTPFELLKKGLLALQIVYFLLSMPSTTPTLLACANTAPEEVRQGQKVIIC